ncbi:MAG: CHAT domain-containing protein [Cyanobacteria bacterium]|nr:CHAT domain-containing protein [Cyanobacteriota bacterium]
MAHGDSDLTPDPVDARLRAAAGCAGGDARRTPDCPGAADIAMFATGDGEAAAAFLSHAATCDYCGPLVDAAVSGMTDRDDDRALLETLHTASPEWRKQMSFRLAAAGKKAPAHRRWLLAAAGLSAAAIIIVAIGLRPEWLMQWRGNVSNTPRLEKLVAAVGNERTVEARLSGGFEHGILSSPAARSGDVETRNLSLVAAAGELQRAAQSDPAPANVHAWGVAQLLLGRFDGAVLDLEDASAADPGNPALLGDLAAAYFARYRALDRADDLPRALDTASRAREIDPKRPEVAFTYALTLQEMRLVDRAADAWRAYLEIDAVSGWADEAKQRLAELTKPSARLRFDELRGRLLAAVDPGDDILIALVAEFPDDLPELVLSDLGGRWANAVDSGVHESAAAMWARAIRLARAYSERTGDAALLHACERARNEPQVVEGLKALTRGAASFRDDDFSLSEPALREARRRLADGFPALAGWAALGLGHASYLRGSMAEAHAFLTEATSLARGSGQRVLEGRAARLQGLVHFSQGEWIEARAAYERSIRIYDHSSNDRGAALVRANLAVLHRFQGDRPAGWHERNVSLIAAPAHKPYRYHGFLMTAAVSASLDGFDHAALLFFDAALANASLGLAPQYRTEVLLQRARMYARLRNVEAAAADISGAEQAWAAITAALPRQLLRLSIATAKTQVWSQLRPAEAVTAALDALELARQRNDSLRSAEIHLYLARAYQQSGDRQGASTALEAGIIDFERARSRMPVDDPVRLSAIEPVWELFDESIALNYDAALYDRAFTAFERSRARTLLEATRQEVRSIANVQAGLAPSSALVLLHQRPRELIVWLITRDTSSPTRIDQTREQAERLVMRCRRSLGRADDVEASRAITEGWLLPALNASKSGTLIIVPDAPYRGLAWAALKTAAGEPIISERAIVIGTSASSVTADAAALRPPNAALIVAATELAGKPPLPGARAEGLAVAGLYGSRALTGDEATPDALLTQASQQDVIHIAAHAVESATYPLLSRLLLSPGRGGDGGLSAAQIVRGPRLKSGTVVVLAACASIGQRGHRGEGTIGIAWSYLWLGARSVVGTLWEIDDRQAAGLFVDFHRELKAGVSPAVALQRAQLKARGRGVPIQEWAAVQVIGRT